MIRAASRALLHLTLGLVLAAGAGAQALDAPDVAELRRALRHHEALELLRANEEPDDATARAIAVLALEAELLGKVVRGEGRPTEVVRRLAAARLTGSEELALAGLCFALALGEEGEGALARARDADPTLKDVTDRELAAWRGVKVPRGGFFRYRGVWLAMERRNRERALDDALEALHAVRPDGVTFRFAPSATESNHRRFVDQYGNGGADFLRSGAKAVRESLDADYEAVRGWIPSYSKLADRNKLVESYERLAPIRKEALELIARYDKPQQPRGRRVPAHARGALPEARAARRARPAAPVAHRSRRGVGDPRARARARGRARRGRPLPLRLREAGPRAAADRAAPPSRGHGQARAPRTQALGARGRVVDRAALRVAPDARRVRANERAPPPAQCAHHLGTDARGRAAAPRRRAAQRARRDEPRRGRVAVPRRAHRLSPRARARAVRGRGAARHLRAQAQPGDGRPRLLRAHFAGRTQPHAHRPRAARGLRRRRRRELPRRARRRARRVRGLVPLAGPPPRAREPLAADGRRRGGRARDVDHGHGRDRHDLAHAARGSAAGADGGARGARRRARGVGQRRGARSRDACEAPRRAPRLDARARAARLRARG